jgi:hypothetical protein
MMHALDAQLDDFVYQSAIKAKSPAGRQGFL